MGKRQVDQMAENLAGTKVGLTAASSAVDRVARWESETVLQLASRRAAHLVV